MDKDEKRIVSAALVPNEEAPSRARQLLDADDVLISTVRPNLNGVALVPEEFTNSIGSTGFSVLRARKNKITPRYLLHIVKAPSFVDFLVRHSTGANYPAVTDGVVRSYEIPLPPLEEQRRIADTLDKADAIRRKRAKALTLADNFLHSVFLEMFGDPIVNPKGWESAEIGELTTAVRDGPHVSPDYVEEGIPILSTRNIRPSQLIFRDVKHISHADYNELTRKFRPRRGDVLLKKGGTTGFAKAVDWDWPFAVWVHLAVLRPNSSILPIFLEHMLNTPACYRQSQLYTRGIVNRDLGLSRIRKIRGFVPPLRAQAKFCEIAGKVADWRHNLGSSTSRIAALAASLAAELLQ